MVPKSVFRALSQRTSATATNRPVLHARASQILSSGRNINEVLGAMWWCASTHCNPLAQLCPCAYIFQKYASPKQTKRYWWAESQRQGVYKVSRTIPSYWEGWRLILFAPHWKLPRVFYFLYRRSLSVFLLSGCSKRSTNKDEHWKCLVFLFRKMIRGLEFQHHSRFASSSDNLSCLLHWMLRDGGSRQTSAYALCQSEDEAV